MTLPRATRTSPGWTQGGFAVVYRARDILFDRPVALKILRSEASGECQLRRCRAECLATGRV